MRKKRSENKNEERGLKYPYACLFFHEAHPITCTHNYAVPTSTCAVVSVI